MAYLPSFFPRDGRSSAPDPAGDLPRRDPKQVELRAGDLVDIFIRAFDVYVEARVATVESNGFVRVHFQHGGVFCRKLVRPQSVVVMEAEVDPAAGEWATAGGRRHFCSRMFKSPAVDPAAGGVDRHCGPSPADVTELRHVGDCRRIFEEPFFYFHDLTHPVPRAYPLKAQAADFLTSKAVARTGGSESSEALQKIDTAIRCLELRGCSDHELGPEYDGKRPLTLVTNDDLRLHHIDSETKQNIDWLPEYRRYADLTQFGVLVIASSEKTFRYWIDSGACARETRGLATDRLWVFDGDRIVRFTNFHGGSVLQKEWIPLIQKTRLDNVKAALRMGVDVNAEDDLGFRPIDWAVWMLLHREAGFSVFLDEACEIALLLKESGAQSEAYDGDIVADIESIKPSGRKRARNSTAVPQTSRADVALQRLQRFADNRKEAAQRSAGVSVVRRLMNAGVSVKLFSVPDLVDAGFSAKDLADAGFPAIALKDAGFSAKDFGDAGFYAKDLKSAGVDAGNLRDAGFSAYYLRNICFSATELKNAGFSAKDLVDARLPADELEEAGFLARSELRNAGFTPRY